MEFLQKSMVLVLKGLDVVPIPILGMANLVSNKSNSVVLFYIQKKFGVSPTSNMTCIEDEIVFSYPSI